MADFLDQILTIDLTQREIQISDFREELAKKYLGGRGLNSWQIFKHIAKGTEPLSPENHLVFSCGLLTGTGVPASSRLHVSARSPLTGLLGSSNVGGHFGAELRGAGFQGILIRGRSEKPVFLWIKGGEVEIRDAGRLWGQDAWRTQTSLKEMLNDSRVKIMAIGQGGENAVRYACIMTDRGHSAGRTGMGAVMGAKNLKAIAVRGEKSRREWGHSARAVVRSYLDQIVNAPRYGIYAKYSNTVFVAWADQMGMLATRNYRQAQFEDVEKIDGRRIIDYVTKPRSCYRCPVHCKADLKIERGRFAGTEGDRPDIEPIVALGSKCGLSDVEAVLYLYNLCGQLGIDVISTGSALAFAMDLYERGIISKGETDGLELTWGNDEAMEAMIGKIARREGFGNVLAEGVRQASQIIGRGSEEFAYHSKGLELTAFDPRGAMGTALGYAVSTRGGDFTSVYATPEFRWDPERAKVEFGTERAADRFSIEGKGRLVKRAMIVSAVLDSLGLCKVPILSIICDFDLKSEAELTSALTGWQMEADDLLTIGERILNVEKLFNLRHGGDKEGDKIPDKFTREVLSHGAARGKTVDIEPMVREFYATMGWDTSGNPTPEKLKELDLWEAFI
ncbi:MAG: aldehyde ferredoxin oxidoreductase family protein [Anaerolineae bacterium]